MTDHPQSADGDVHPVEIELSRKLLTTSHLNAPERAILSNRVRFSVLLRLVQESLAEHDYFPSHLRPESAFNRVVIEKQGAVYWTHERYESGVDRFGPVISRLALSLGEALRVMLARGAIDGVIVDFHR